MSSSRRSSISSASDDSDGLHAVDSTSHLVLVHDDDDEDDNLFDFDEGENEQTDSQFQLGRSSAQSLSPTLVFLYLLSPHLKLGSMLLPNVGIPLKFGLPALFLFAFLSAFARQIWFMLGRHIRKDDLVDAVVDVFARSRRRMNRRRQVIRSIVQLGTGVLRILLAIVYLRVAVALLVPLLTDDLPTVTPTVLCFILGFFLFPFCLGQSLASRTIIYSTWISIATYIVWFILVAYAHSKGALKVSESWLRMGTLWQGITTIAFAFSTSNTLTLHASLKASMQPNSSAVLKRPLSRSFRFLSLISVALAVCFAIPLIVFAAFPNRLQAKNPALKTRPFIMFFDAATLITGSPSILATTPKLPIPEHISQRMAVPTSRILVFLVVVFLAFVPAKVSGILSDILLSCALFATYSLPALLHIINHFFRRPLSIVVPTNPSTPNPSATFGDDAPQSSADDPLLRRKEQALQRKQWQRRIIWDLGVWILLVPIGGGGFAWAVGKISGRW